MTTSKIRQLSGSPDEISPFQPLTFDPSRYRNFLESDGLNQAQQDKHLEAMWSMVVNFVDMGFGLHPVQQVVGVAATPEEPKKRSARRMNAKTVRKLSSEAKNLKARSK